MAYAPQNATLYFLKTEQLSRCKIQGLCLAHYCTDKGHTEEAVFKTQIHNITAKIQQSHATGENTTHSLTTLGQNYLPNHQDRRTPT